MNWGAHPLNLALRFVLELLMVYGFGRWGWTRLGDGPGRYALAILVPVMAAALWGTFAVPEDPSRSGLAPVPTPGAVRLLLELGLFATATAGLYASDASRAALVLAVLTLAHYAMSVDRILWLLKH
jgi:hypothetical protein